MGEALLDLSLSDSEPPCSPSCSSVCYRGEYREKEESSPSKKHSPPVAFSGEGSTSILGCPDDCGHEASMDPAPQQPQESPLQEDMTALPVNEQSSKHVDSSMEPGNSHMTAWAPKLKNARRMSAGLFSNATGFGNHAWLRALPPETRSALERCESAQEARQVIQEALRPSIKSSMDVASEFGRLVTQEQRRVMDLEHQLENQRRAQKAELASLQQNHRAAVREAKLQVLMEYAPASSAAAGAKLVKLRGHHVHSSCSDPADSCDSDAVFPREAAAQDMRA